MYNFNEVAEQKARALKTLPLLSKKGKKISRLIRRHTHKLTARVSQFVCIRKRIAEVKVYSNALIKISIWLSNPNKLDHFMRRVLCYDSLCMCSTADIY